MTEADSTIAETYVRLALAIEPHNPGNVDAYYGPLEWRAEAEAAPTRPIEALREETDALAQRIEQADIDPRRQDFLRRQVRAIAATLARSAGELTTMTTEVEAIFDVQPTWTEEAIFEGGHRVLDQLLPPGGTLAERVEERNKRTEVPVDRLQPLIPDLFAELRRRTRERFPLPDDEGVEFEWANDQPWGAYNWYRGNRRSLIEINTDKPQRVTDLVMLLAHEAYPGHHTEHACKETRLVRDQGRIEHCIALLNSPACTIAEGIATLALSAVVSDEEWIRWHADEIFPRAGCDHLNAEHEHAIIAASEVLRGARGNAAFMLHDQGATPDEVAAYLERWGLLTPDNAQRAVRFISTPVARSYTFTYSEGRALLDALFEQRGDRDAWFTRLLTETVTPEQVRRWTKGE